MPDESCRNCGGKLSENTKCFQSMKPNSMICNDCALCTQEQFHSSCMYYDANTINTESKIGSDNYAVIITA